MITIRVRYFQLLRDLAGREAESLQMEPAACVADLRAAVLSRHHALVPLERSLMIAVNDELATPSTPLADGDRVDFMPPFSGG